MNLRHDSFIHSEFIDTKICDDLITWFNNTADDFKYKGFVATEEGRVIDTTAKESVELSISCDSFGYPFGEYRKALQNVLNNYVDKYQIVGTLSHFDILSHYNFQYYPPGGGYKYLHTENAGGSVDSARTLVFMTYLNDVPNGGTRFTAQDINVQAVKGKTLIWPAYFTHEHVGIITDTHEKMIITGWYEFVNVKRMLDTYQDLKDILQGV